MAKKACDNRGVIAESFMTPDQFRRLALEMPDAEERSHMGHPDFRANGRIFASLHSGDRFGMVKLTPEEQRVVMRESPETFVPSAGAWGRQGCTNVCLEVADVKAVRAAMVLAWEHVAALPARRARPAKLAMPAKPAKAPKPAKPATPANAAKAAGPAAAAGKRHAPASRARKR